jgi:hypothetical protein
MRQVGEILPAPVGIHHEACQALQDAIYISVDDSGIFHGENPTVEFNGLTFVLRRSSYDP